VSERRLAEPYTGSWPRVGVRTWQPTPGFVFPGCTGRPGCPGEQTCTVGVRDIAEYVYGCPCGCHDQHRKRLEKTMPTPAGAWPEWARWWNHQGRPPAG
jgi:hypothetical protein